MKTFNRREFLAAGAAATAVAPGLYLLSVSVKAAPEATATAGDQQARSDVRWGMLVDASKCKTGCEECIKACNQENAINEIPNNPRQGSQWIRKIELKPKQGTAPNLSLPMMCQHCSEPPCVDVCPTGASFKRVDGIVLVDRHTCIGCRYCMMACPFKARSLVHQPLTQQNPQVPRGMGCVESCTFCVHRVDRGLRPACSEACPEGALTFGDLNDSNSEISRKLVSANSVQVRADLKLNTAVRYQGLGG